MTQVALPAEPDLHWQTQLFASDRVCRSTTGRERLSPRAAYQELLYGRAVLVDLRPVEERAAHGEIHPDLRPVLADRTLSDQGNTPVILLCQEGHASLVAAESMRRGGQEQVADIEGGFRAWNDLGLPTR